MKKIIVPLFSTITIFLIATSCQKQTLSADPSNEQNNVPGQNVSLRTIPGFNLEAILRGEGKAFGLVEFRQDNSGDKIISLDTWVRDLQPNHSYKLQRAVDAANVVDGNCTSTAWLTLGKGLVAQDIVTDESGTGRADLWRALPSTIAAGTRFDIHFRVIDAVSSAVVLTSDCYQYTVR